jgi:hypothetical protein
MTANVQYALSLSGPTGDAMSLKQMTRFGYQKLGLDFGPILA